MASVLVVALLASGCSNPIKENQAKLRPWLAENPRVMVVVLGAERPAPVIVDRESRVLAGLKGFALGAVGGAVAPWLSGGGGGDLRGAALLTAAFAAGGAIAGAVMLASDPEETRMPMAEFPEFDAVFGAATDDRRFERALQAKVVALGNVRTRHTLRPAPPRGSDKSIRLPSGTQAVVNLRISTLGFLDDGGQPQRAGLYIQGRAYLARDVVNRRPISAALGLNFVRWHYEGAVRALPVWQANGGAALQAELDRAVDALADKIVAAFVAKDTGSGLEGAAGEPRR